MQVIVMETITPSSIHVLHEVRPFLCERIKKTITYPMSSTYKKLFEILCFISIISETEVW